MMTNKKLIWLALLIGVAHWFFDAAIDALIFRKDTLLSQIFSPSTHEIYMRILVSAFIVATVYIWIIILKQKKTEAVLRSNEERLRTSEEKYRSLVDNIGMSVVLISPDMEILSANKSTRKIFPAVDFDKHPTCYKTFNLPSMEQPCSYCAAIRTFQDGEVHETVTDTPTPHGIRNFSIMTFPIKDSTGRVTAVIEMAEDITERIKTEEDLQNKERLLSESQRIAHIGSLAWEIATGHMTWTDETYRIYGRSPDTTDLSPESFLSLLHPEDRPAMEEWIRGCLAGDKTGDLEFRVILPDSTVRFLSGRGVLEHDADNRPVRMVGTVQDITERKKAGDALKESELRFSSLMQTASDAIIMSDTSGSIISWNAGAERIFGYEDQEVLGKPLTILMPERYRNDHLKGLERVIRTGKTQYLSRTLGFHGIRKDGGEFPLELSINRWKTEKGIYFLGIIRDITERIKLEDQLRQLQKIEGIGHLAGGIAHDFNNILSAVIGFCSLAQTNIEKGSQADSYLNEVLAAGQRGASLTQQLLAFSRKQVLDMKPVNIVDVITGLMKLLLRTIREDIKLSFLPVEQSLVVMADSSQIDQIMINLVTNARDAMPKGGEIRISVEPVTIGPEFINSHGYGDIGVYAVVTITDTGIGMDRETKNRIFEPFFTTKEVGKGTGLGLAVVYGIIKQHNGFVDVHSEPGKGSSFRIFLPLAGSIIAEDKALAVSPVRGGNETILVADDEPTLRKLLKTQLEMFGYSVITAEDGADAVNRFVENRDRVELLILDAIMPNKNGKEALDEIRETAPDIKVLFLSGYPGEMFQMGEHTYRGFEFLSKPVKPDILLKKVREVLDA